MRNVRSVPWIVCFLLVPLASGCRPAGYGDPPPDFCTFHSDCRDNELCNTCAMRCVPVLAVDTNQFAGLFDFVMSDAHAGTDQNAYAMVDLGGNRQEMCDAVLLGQSSDGKQLVVEMDKIISPLELLVMKIFLPSALATPGSPITLRDRLEPTQGGQGYGILMRMMYNPASQSYEPIQLWAEVATGQIVFSQLTLALGARELGFYNGELMPGTSYLSTLLLYSYCPENYLYDPLSGKCVLAFNGWDAMVGMDAVHQGSGSFDNGSMVATYRLGSELSVYGAGGCISTESGSEVVVQGAFVYQENTYRRVEVRFPLNQLSAGKVLDIGSGVTVTLYSVDRYNQIIGTLGTLRRGQVTIRYVRPGPSGRILLNLWGSFS